MEYLFDIKFHRSLNFQNRKLSNVYSFVYKTHETEHRKKITSSIAEKRKEEPEFKGYIIENNIEYRSISKINCVKNNKKTKELRDMLKIMDENICQQIIKKSGKYNFTNECVKKITEKMMNKPDVSPKFYSLKGFVYYMAKCLKRELCNPKKILSKSFEYSVKMTQKENFQIKEHKIPSDLFGQIRKKLIKLYGERGISYDIHWFSKLAPIINKETRTFILESPNQFITDWVKNNYWQKLSIATKHFGLKLVEKT